MTVPKRQFKYQVEPEPPKKRRGGGGRFFLNMLALGAAVAGGIYLMPAEDRQEILGGVLARLEQIKGGDLAAVTPTSAENPAPAPASAGGAAAAAPAGGDGIMSFLAGLIGSAGGSGAPKGVAKIDIRHFPLAYNSWQRTDYLSAGTAEQAMRTMDRLLGSGTTSMADEDAILDRTAAIYRSGRTRLMILIESAPPIAPEPAPVVMTTVSDPAQTSPAKLTDVTAEPDAPPPAPPFNQTIPGLPVVVLDDVKFSDVSGGKKGVLDLKAQFANGVTIYLRGRASHRVAEDFLSRTNLDALGIRL
ncbi:MAG: hypothetical protein AAGE76_06005 [Pseudomonadota bacterium]